MTDTNEYTGGSVSYYTVSVTHPINEAADPYDAECIDIIDALQMTPNEANAFKALWRRAAARLGKSKRGYTDGLYDAEKVEFYGRRLVELERRGRPEQLTVPGVGPVLQVEEPVVLDWAPVAEPPPYDADQIANSSLSASHRDGGGQLYKVCDISGRWLRFGNKCWFFASSDPKAVPEGLKPIHPSTTNPFGPRDADGWYTWNGDDTMRPAGRVDVVFRIDVGVDTATAEVYQWVHSGSPGDIVKWRPAQQ